MNKAIFIALAAALLSACTPSPQQETGTAIEQQQAGIVEITTFKLNPDVSQADFEAAASTVQHTFLEQQNGFISRTLTVSQDGIWTDVVYWKDQQSVENTMKLSETSEVVLALMQLVDFNSVKMNLTTPVVLEE